MDGGYNMKKGILCVSLSLGISIGCTSSSLEVTGQRKDSFVRSIQEVLQKDGVTKCLSIQEEKKSSIINCDSPVWGTRKQSNNSLI